jgi:hypothetical protein
MSYSLDDKITTYLSDHGVAGARVHEAIIVMPTQSGEIHRRVQGVVTKAKLDAIIEEYKATDHAA